MAKLSGRWISKTRRLAIYLRDGFTCCYCGRDLHFIDPSDITLDHLRPRSLGGQHHTKNLVTACRSCNSSRQATRWWKFASPEARIIIRRTRRRVLPLHMARALISGNAGNDEVEVARGAG